MLQGKDSIQWIRNVYGKEINVRKFDSISFSFEQVFCIRQKDNKSEMLWTLVIRVNNR